MCQYMLLQSDCVQDWGGATWIFEVAGAMSAALTAIPRLLRADQPASVPPIAPQVRAKCSHLAAATICPLTLVPRTARRRPVLSMFL